MWGVGPAPESGISTSADDAEPYDDVSPEPVVETEEEACPEERVRVERGGGEYRTPPREVEGRPRALCRLQEAGGAEDPSLSVPTRLLSSSPEPEDVLPDKVPPWHQGD